LFVFLFFCFCFFLSSSFLLAFSQQNLTSLSLSLPADTEGGAYQGGYLDGSAFTAVKKNNADARLASAAVAAGTMQTVNCGFKAPSSIVTMLPQFDVVYGHMIELFHDLQIVSFSNRPQSQLRELSLQSRPT